jgi:hypothetical protein
MNSHGLLTWTVIVWSLQRPSPKSKPKGASTLFLVQNNPSNLMAKILLMIDFLLKRNRWPLDHSLGFHSCPTQTSFESLSPSSKSNRLKLRQPLDFGHTAKGREAELGFLQFDWWKSTASWPSAKVWSAPKCWSRKPTRGEWMTRSHGSSESSTFLRRLSIIPDQVMHGNWEWWTISCLYCWRFGTSFVIFCVLGWTIDFLNQTYERHWTIVDVKVNVIKQWWSERIGN